MIARIPCGLESRGECFACGLAVTAAMVIALPNGTVNRIPRIRQ
jgi:hypothetical protein